MRQPRIPGLRHDLLIDNPVHRKGHAVGPGERHGRGFIGPVAPDTPRPLQHTFLGFLLGEERALRGVVITLTEKPVKPNDG